MPKFVIVSYAKQHRLNIPLTSATGNGDDEDVWAY